ncbi:MAG TPA: Fe(2+) transporter permease subunit FeoB [Spirochaetota bacterium]|nr:Fe(2+) transporter permease subunit FeoB [Spirochaetota bacterium]HPJ34397.1 Fe(2+) transporter permease subunit FeoB [Spirochaetota bacterium]
MRTIAIIGNPNCGKTTLFNGLTGSNQRIGNWPGVTVEKIEGIMRHESGDIRVIDLPGIYSLSAFSEDERVSREYLMSGKADLVINIVDASNLERNLYLTTQIIELKVPVIIVLNRVDMAEKQKKVIDSGILSSQLGCPVIETVATRRGEMEDIKERIVSHIGSVEPSSRRIEFPNEIEEIIRKWSGPLENISSINSPDPAWAAIKILEKDQWVTGIAVSLKLLSAEDIDNELTVVEKLLHESSDIIIADYRYGFIQGITRKCVIRKSDKKEITDLLDNILLNRFLALPLFALAMYAVFWVTLFAGGAFIDFFSAVTGAVFIDGTRFILQAINAPEWFVTVFADGAGGGIQAVASFIPVVFAMFFMLAILEDSGYMARAAFIMDRFMRFIGLPGKAFLPLMIGFGCSVPAVMAARTLDRKRDRIITVFMTPFMSCGARLSVYALFTSAFFHRSAGLIVLSLYAVGVILAVLTGLLIKKSIYTGEVSYFVMELPTYNLPRFKHIMIHTWTRLNLFLFSAGKIIVIAVMVLSFMNSLGTDGSFGNENSSKSVLTKLGKNILPIFTPFGVEEKNWPAAVALFSGPFAKEAIVGTLNTLYLQMDHSAEIVEERMSIKEKIIEGIKTVPVNLAQSIPGCSASDGESSEGDSETMLKQMRRHFGGGAGAYAYLLFILLYFPCIATVGAVYREAGWFVAVTQAVYMTILAWCASVLFYQTVAGHSIFWIALSIAILILIVLVFFITGRIIRKKVTDFQ